MLEFEPTNHGYLKPAAEEGSAKLGGRVVEMTASGALLIGDAVLVSAADTVLKTETTTDHKNRLGIVVGGTATNMKVLSGSDAVGLAAAASGEQVLVQIDGIAYGVADVTTIAVGDKLKLGSTTAGRVMDGTDTTDGAAGITGSIVGQALETVDTAGLPVKMLITLG